MKTSAENQRIIELVKYFEKEAEEFQRLAEDMRAEMPVPAASNSGLYLAGQMDGLATAYGLAARKIQKAIKEQQQ